MTEQVGEKPTPWILLPPAPDRCQVCAGNHRPDFPHNQQSIYYQTAFFVLHGRWPTWKDAMEHCLAEIREAWTEELRKRGITIE